MQSKTLHIIYSGLGGTADYVFNLIRGDVEQKIHHHILFYGVEDVPADQLDFAKSICSDVFVIQKETGVDKNALKEISETLLEQDFKSISLHVNSLILHLPKLMQNQSKLIFVEHQSNQLKTRKEWLWSILAQRKAELVISLTPEYQNELKSKLRFLYKSTKNHLIKTGLHLADYQPNIASSNKLKVGMVSRINELKDHKTLIKAFEELDYPESELHIAGDGPSLKELKTLSQSEKTKFTGMLSKGAVVQFMSNLTIYVQATKGETSSLAIMQAQCSALPIIASNVKGVQNMLDDSNAILVELENVQDMKNALDKLFKSSELRKKLALSSSVYAEGKLDNKKMFYQFEKLF
ncbi:MAG: glycosyltransferase involved in cell wall biosynthesis [Arenicella sp.]|jgi:glycosyltransferase involved in cell wall biosynthesis